MAEIMMNGGFEGWAAGELATKGTKGSFCAFCAFCG
jgi:hypothetical protein